MHNNVDGDIIKNAAGNGYAALLQAICSKMPNLKVRHLVQVSTFNLDCSLLTYDTTKNPTEADQNASKASTKQ